MTSRLSSLLVSGGVVAVRRMEKAFQRQVLFGGGLDTILLEMNELPEQRLVQFLSMATGLPPATARELDGADPRAAARCSRDLAERFSVVPLWFEGEALRVLTRDPVDLGALEVLANELEVAIQPFVAPEFRYELAFDKVYGRASDERFTRLAEASRLSAIPPAGRAPSVVVETAATKSGSIPLPSQARAGAELGAAPAAAPASGSDAAAAGTAPTQARAAEGGARVVSPGFADGGVGAPVAGTAWDADEVAAEAPADGGVAGGAATAEGRAAQGVAGGAAAAEARVDQGVAGGEVAAEAPADRAVAGGAAAADISAVAGGGAGAEASADGAGGTGAEGSGPVGRRTLEMTPEAVRQRREEVERQAADAYRRHTGPEAVVQPSDDEAAAAGNLEAEQATTPSARLPTEAEMAAGDADAAPVVFIEYETSEATALAVTAPFARAVGEDRPGAIVSGEISAGSSAPPVIEASAAPTAPLAAGDSAPTVHPFRQTVFDPAPLEIGEARELLVQAEHRDRVFEVLLRAVRARTWYVALLTVQGGAAIGRVAIAGDEVDNSSITQVLIPLDVPSSFRQTVSSTSPYIGPVQTGDADIDGMIRRMGGVIPPSALLMPLVLRNRVVALLIGHRGGDMLRVTEVSELLPLAAAASDALGRIIRRGKKSRQMPAVLASAAASLAAAVPEAPESIDDGAPTTRMAIVNVPDAEIDTGTATDPRADRSDGADPSLSPLARQVLDPDPRVRDAALERLASGPRAQLDEALADLRTALASDDATLVSAAAAALAALVDVRSIPALLDAHARGGEHGRAATGALVSLTKQDLGDSTRKWRQWWEKNRRKNRIEWLLEGLSNKDTDIRRSAVEELRRATGEFFGYHPDLPRREREQARQRWIVWWQETGRLRFLPDGDLDRAQAGGAAAARPREY